MQRVWMSQQAYNQIMKHTHKVTRPQRKIGYPAGTKSLRAYYQQRNQLKQRTQPKRPAYTTQVDKAVAVGRKTLAHYDAHKKPTVTMDVASRLMNDVLYHYEVAYENQKYLVSDWRYLRDIKDKYDLPLTESQAAYFDGYMYAWMAAECIKAHGIMPNQRLVIDLCKKDPSLVVKVDYSAGHLSLLRLSSLKRMSRWMFKAIKKAEQ